MKKKKRKPKPLNNLRQFYELIERGGRPIWHNVQLEAVVNSHEFGPSPVTGGQPGPMRTQKIVKFTGTGNTVDAASAEAHKQLTAFLESDGCKIGSDNETAPSGSESPILQPFGGKH